MTEQPAPIAASTLPRVTVASLFNGQRELVLVHQGQDYHLRITRNGKLILTK